jgi:hypothetical protein
MKRKKAKKKNKIRLTITQLWTLNTQALFFLSKPTSFRKKKMTLQFSCHVGICIPYWIHFSEHIVLICFLIRHFLFNTCLFSPLFAVSSSTFIFSFSYLRSLPQHLCLFSSYWASPSTHSCLLFWKFFLLSKPHGTSVAYRKIISMPRYYLQA